MVQRPWQRMFFEALPDAFDQPHITVNMSNMSSDSWIFRLLPVKISENAAKISRHIWPAEGWPFVPLVAAVASAGQPLHRWRLAEMERPAEKLNGHGDFEVDWAIEAPFKG